MMFLNPNFFHFPHSKLSVSKTPKPNTFTFTCTYQKSKPLFIFSFTKSHSLEPNRSNSFHFAASRNEEHGISGSGFQKILEKRVGFISSILPGGSWWTLSEHHRGDEAEAAEPMAVTIALRRMWELVADEQWVAFAAIGSLVVAADPWNVRPGLAAKQRIEIELRTRDSRQQQAIASSPAGTSKGGRRRVGEWQQLSTKWAAPAQQAAAMQVTTRASSNQQGGQR